MSSKHGTKILIIGIVFGMILSACQSSTPNAALSAGIKELMGTVSIKQAGSSDYVKATSNSTLQEKGSVQTGADGRVRLDLSTGTIIRLSPSSLFTLVSNQPSNNNLITTLKLDIGRVFIILNGGSVDVNTPSGVASVRGSYESVAVDPVTHDVTVTCLEGHCSATNPAGTVELINGQKTLLFHFDPATGRYTAPGVEPMTADDFQKWLNENPEAANILNQVFGTLTAMAPTEAPVTPPPATQAPATQAPNNQPTSGPLGCSIIGPLGGSSLPKYGPVTFAWNAQAGASKYIVTFHFPDGGTAQFITTDTSLTRFAESMTPGGTYSWDVTAVDAAGNKLCKSDAVGFTKEKLEPDKPKPPVDCSVDPSSPKCPPPVPTLPPT